ncbi:MAG: hypothetical protein B7733_21545 [Myxococcales bacterium FL481]|nr:MAG: hypothetical protein B7733_21545 [Myxococcales bacterium FL481]
MTGSALASLGLLRLGATAGLLVATAESRCPHDSAYFNSVDECEATRVYAWVGAGLGAALLTSGVVLLVKAARARHKHRQWRRYGGGWAHAGAWSGGPSRSR